MKRTPHSLLILIRFPLLTGFLLPLLLTGQETLPDASNPAASSLSAGAERTLMVHAVPTGETLHPFWSVANFTHNDRRTFSKRSDGMLLRNRSPFAREVVVDYVLGGRIPGGEEYYHGLDAEGGLMVDFTKMIRRVRHAIEAGYRPWIGLENVPPAMSDPVRWNTYGNSAPPADYDLFERYVRLAMQALVEAFGEETVASWSFIIATEPDLYPGHWSGSKEEFYTLLDHTLRPALQVVPGISISPGNILNPGYARRKKSAANPDGLVRSRDHWGLDIIDYMASGDINTGGRKGSRMDFFSFSWYGRIGREMDTFDRAVSVTRERLSRYPRYADIPLDVREFAVLHDEEGRRFYAGDATEWAASFYAALARRVYDQGVRFVFEWDHATLGVLHPRGQVIRFLERMEGGKRLPTSVTTSASAAEGHSIAALQDDSLYVLVYHHLSTRDEAPSEGIQLELAQGIFPAGPALEVDEWRVDRNHTTWMYAFLEDARRSGLEPLPEAALYEASPRRLFGDPGLQVFKEHIERYRAIAQSEPIRIHHALEPEGDGGYRFSFRLPPRSVRLFRLTPVSGQP